MEFEGAIRAKGQLRRDMIETLLHNGLTSCGVQHEVSDIQKLADVVLDREFPLAFALPTNSLSYEELEEERWKIDTRIIEDVIREQVGLQG